MKKEDYQNDLTAIRSMMERSSRFISLSGLAGVCAGIYAIAGALYACYCLKNAVSAPSHLQKEITLHLLVVAALVLALAVGTAAFFTMRKSKKNNLQILDRTTKRLIFNFAVPLAAGGIFTLILLWYGEFEYLAPATLVFYGLALFNAGNFTFPDIRILGICEVLLGLFSLVFLDCGLLFWTLGFGVLHITYGIIMYVKYK